jgi:hypothetical protein
MDGLPFCQAHSIPQDIVFKDEDRVPVSGVRVG